MLPIAPTATTILPSDTVTTTLLSLTEGMDTTTTPSITATLGALYNTDENGLFAIKFRYLMMPKIGEDLFTAVNDPGKAVRKSVIDVSLATSGDLLMVRVLTIPGSHVVPFHQNTDKEKTLILVKGHRINVFLHYQDQGRQEAHELAQGMSIVIPKGCWHAIESVSIESVQIVIVGSNRDRGVRWEKGIEALMLKYPKPKSEV